MEGRRSGIPDPSSVTLGLNSWGKDGLPPRTINSVYIIMVMEISPIIMPWARFVVVGIVGLALIGGISVAPAGVADENPACSSPSQGQARSVAASDGTSLERAARGLNNALAHIGCERRL